MSAPTLNSMYESLPSINSRDRLSIRGNKKLVLDGTKWAVRTKCRPYKSYSLIAESSTHKLSFSGYTTLEWDDDEAGMAYEVPIDEYLLEKPLFYARPNSARLDIRSRMPVRGQLGGVTMTKIESLEDRLVVPEAFRVFHGFAHSATANLVVVEPVVA